MAASLNTPSSFTRDSSDKPVLLPPSTFEKPAQKSSAVDPWRALAKATGEILDLKQENTKLKETKQISFPIGEEIKARVDLHQHGRQTHTPPPQHPQPHPPHPTHQDHLQLTYFHDLINRQAAEISQLQGRLTTKTADAEKSVSRLECQLSTQEVDYVRKVAALEEKIRTTESQYEVEMNKLHASHENLVHDQSQAMKHLREETENKERIRLEEINRLTQELNQSEEVLRKVEQDLTGKLRITEKTIEEQQQTITKMQTYLHDNQTSSKSTEIWRKEVEQLNKKLQIEQSATNKLQEEKELLNIRLKSQGEILTIQELELSKLKDVPNEKKKQCLLTRWREKVYTLLVQLKCSELVQKEQDRTWSQQLHDLQNEVERHQSEVNMLKCSLQDKQAELDMERHTNRTLEEELTKAQQIAISLDDRSQSDKRAVNFIGEQIFKFSEVFAEFEAANAKVTSALASHNQRIAYASGRVEVLQGQFVRKEALIRLEMEQKLSEKPTRDTVEEPAVLDSSPAHLQNELCRVTEERDLLAAQVKSDAQLLEGRIAAAHHQVADEVQSLKQRLDDLHLQLDDKTKAHDELHTEVERLHHEQEESNETIESLKMELAKSHVQAKSEAESARRDEQSRFTEQLAEMERKLNEARREQTKAVVSLRQFERQMTRDKERSAEAARTAQDLHKAALAKLEAKWRSADKDRNLLMATLRQEGLLGRYRSQRLTPVPLPDHDDSLANEEQPTRGSCEQGAELRAQEAGREAEITMEASADMTGQSETEEPLHAVIDDLKSLTRAVFDEPPESDENDETNTYAHDRSLEEPVLEL